MNVLIIARGFSDKENIIGSFELEQAEALLKKGCEVRVIAHDSQSFKHVRKYGKVKYMRNGVQLYIYSFPCRIMPKKIAKLFRQNVVLKLYDWVTADGWKPDIIHAHFGSVAYTALKVVNKCDAKFVITEHYSGMNTLHPDKNLFNESVAAYSKADKLIAVGSHFANTLYTTTGYKFDVVPNLLNPAVFDETFGSRINSAFHKKRIEIISAGNYYENKQFPLLVEVLSLLKDKYDFHLCIYGSGPERKNIQFKIDTFGMEEYVTLNGHLSNTELIEKMLDSDVYISLSKTETFGVAFIEAMACGLPALSLRCGGTDDTIDIATGIIVDSNEPKYIADKVSNMFDDLNMYNRSNISNKMINKYSSTKVASELIKIYAELIL